MAAVVVDAGPLVALFDQSDRHHRWAEERVEEMRFPLLVCEPVLTEAMYLLAGFWSAQDELMSLIEDEVLAIGLQIDEHFSAVRQLLQKYREVPMSLADACVVRMAEIHDGSAVFTLDSDFTVYRKNVRMPIDLIYPPFS